MMSSSAPAEEKGCGSFEGEVRSGRPKHIMAANGAELYNCSRILKRWRARGEPHISFSFPSFSACLAGLSSLSLPLCLSQYEAKGGPISEKEKRKKKKRQKITLGRNIEAWKREKPPVTPWKPTEYEFDAGKGGVQERETEDWIPSPRPIQTRLPLPHRQDLRRTRPSLPRSASCRPQPWPRTECVASR